MNRHQRKLLKVVAIVVLGMLLFPSFYRAGERGELTNWSYAFLFLPPRNGFGQQGLVDVPLLLTQWAGVGIVATIAWFLLDDLIRR